MHKRFEYLTPQMFAERRGVSRPTVHNWMKRGILKGVIRTNGDSGFYLIPESNLDIEIEIRGPGRPLNNIPKSNIPKSLKEKFEAVVGMRRSSITYDELYQLFERNASYEEIASITGVSRQAIAQTYKKYFSHIFGPKMESRKRVTRKKIKERFESSLDKVEKLSILKRIVENVGLEIKPIPAVNSQGYGWCKVSKVEINGKLCAVYHAKETTEPSPRAYRVYYRPNISKGTVEKTDFVLVMTGRDVERVFVIPSKILLDSYGGSSRSMKTFYFPTEKYPPYNNMFPDIDWWQFEDAWNQLK